MYANHHSIHSIQGQALNQQAFYDRLVLASLFLVAAFVFSSNATASENAETECFNYVQDKITWNYDHDSRWKPENIKQLCKGTTQYKEPGECFNRVMHSSTYGDHGINWGDGNKWAWKNAVALCTGTDSADGRIGCFENRISDGKKWDAAIAQCVTFSSASRKSN